MVVDQPPSQQGQCRYAIQGLEQDLSSISRQNRSKHGECSGTSFGRSSSLTSCFPCIVLALIEYSARDLIQYTEYAESLSDPIQGLFSAPVLCSSRLLRCSIRMSLTFVAVSISMSLSPPLHQSKRGTKGGIGFVHVNYVSATAIISSREDLDIWHSFFASSLSRTISMRSMRLLALYQLHTTNTSSVVSLEWMP